MTFPASIVIVTKNEEARIAQCLSYLQECDDIWVVDSLSRDKTADIARAAGVQLVPYQWNGTYPKKRQWCLDHLDLKYDWVFWVDADETVCPEVLQEIRYILQSYPENAGFFITGQYRVNNKILRFGIPNQKIALFHKERMMFPEIDDLDIPGMGEIEGHYQPVLRSGHNHRSIGRIKAPMVHEALCDERSWMFRHEKYARWEHGMNTKNAWPKDPIAWRERVKRALRKSRFRPEIIFLIGYIGKLGFLDGREGLYIARLRYHYYKMIRNFIDTPSTAV